VADLPSRQDLFSVGRRYIKGQPNTRINPKVVDVAGSDANIIVGQASVMGENLVAAWARCMRDLFVDTARQDGLDRLAYDRFGITRKPANAATTGVLLSRPTAGAGGGVLQAGFRFTTAQGSTFSLMSDAVFNAPDLEVAADVVAAIVGPDQNVPAGAISLLGDQAFDPTITVTNPEPAAGGTVQESDPRFRGRIRGYYITLRRATLGAIQYAALTVPGVSVSSAFEISNPGSGLPAGAVELVIGDDAGNASGPMLQAVSDVLLQFRACGIPVFVSGGLISYEPVTYKLAYSTGIDTQQAQAEVRAVAVSVAQFLIPGQPLRRADMIGAAKAVPGVLVNDDSLVVPAGDVVPTSNSILIRVRPEDVSFT